MGLGAPKRRNKLSQDPNNTQWSKSTNTYGHKILSAQGWKPGDYLGAENASHADHYTGANASHIRVLLREDNLGLGAKIGKVNAETFGLSLFSGVLGRLNGKSDAEVEKHQSALRDAELRTYQAQKHGHLNFVSGGFLVGDRIQSSADEGMSQNKNEQNSRGTEKVEGRSKKREGKVAATDRKMKKRKTHAATESSTTEGIEDSQRSEDAEEDVAELRAKTKEGKKSKSGRKANAGDDDANTTAEDGRPQRKQDRRARKEERRKRKEEKRRSASQTTTPKAESTENSQDDRDSETAPVKQDAGPFLGNRHAVRQRYIQQKRMASLDPQAMKEIFMLKPAVTAA